MLAKAAEGERRDRTYTVLLQRQVRETEGDREEITGT